MMHDTNKLYTLLPLQSEEGQVQLQKYSLALNDFDTVVLIENEKVYTASTAALMIMKNLSGIVQYMHLFIVVPRPIRDFIYVHIAKNRYALFGKTKTCSIPTKDQNIKGCTIELQDTISRENLRILMTSFYKKAILDSELGPYFTNELGDNIEDEDWVAHIDLLADFWLTELLGKDTYVGNFIGAHIKLPHIKKETFSTWIKLFSEAAEEVYVPPLAERFKKHGVLLSKQFISHFKPPKLKSSAIFQIKGKE